MSRLQVVCVLLLIVLAAFQVSGPSQQPPENQNARPKWEYKVFSADANNCSLESYLTGALNSLGQEGWELVGYQRIPAAFPKEAEGALLIKPAATGSGSSNYPQTADSFEGNINMKIATVPPGGCQLVLKRQSRALRMP
jgi:hypothetical protein